MKQELIQTDMSPSDLSIDEIDEYVRKSSFNSRSELIRYLLEKQILGIRTKIQDILLYVMLMVIIVMILVLLIAK